MSKDIFGNEISVGSSILYCDGTESPCCSKVEKVTATRVYFTTLFSNRHYYRKVNSYRRCDQVVVLEAYGQNRESVSIKYKNSVGKQDMSDRPLSVGDKVIYLKYTGFRIGVVDRFSKVKVFIKECDSTWEFCDSTYTRYVLKI